MIKKAANYFISGFMWLVVIALGFWFFLVSRNSFLGILARFYVKGDQSLARSMEVRFFEKVFIVIVGILFAIGMLAALEYFRFGAGKPGFIHRIALVIGIELILVFTADFILFWAQDFQITYQLRWPILTGEILLGLGLLIFSIRSHKLRKL